MDIPNETLLPLSSNDPLLGLLDCYIESFGDNIPEEAYLDVFEQENLKFELFSQTSKYLGEDLFNLNTQDIRQTQTIQNDISTGNNLFNPFRNFGSNVAASFALSSSDFGNTAGSTLDNADIVWQFVDNTLEGAWYKRFDEVFDQKTTCLKIDTGSFEMRFPFGDRGVSGDGLEWSGMGIDNCQRPIYINQNQQDLNEEIDQIYWSQTDILSSVSPMALNQSTLIQNGANANQNIFKADQIQVKPTRLSTEEEFAWLYAFDHTELPISCGRNQIYWPMFRYDDNTRTFPFDIPINQTEDIPLSSVFMTKQMCGSVAGLTPSTSDQMFKRSGLCEQIVEGAWLEGCDVSELAQDIYLSANILDVCENSNFYFGDGFVGLRGSCLSSVNSPILDVGCGIESIDQAEFTGSSEYSFSNIIGNNDVTSNLGENIIRWGITNTTNSGQSSISIEPNTFNNVSFNKFFELGDISFTNTPISNSSSITRVNLDINLTFGDVTQLFSFPIQVDTTVVNSDIILQNADVITLLEPNINLNTFSFFGVQYNLEIEFLESSVENGVSQKNRIFANERTTVTTKLIGRLNTENVSSNLVSYNYRAFEFVRNPDLDYNLIKDGQTITIEATSDAVNIPDQEFNWEMGTDGFDLVTFENSDNGISEIVAKDLLTCSRPVVKSIQGASRQNGFFLVAPTGQDTPFFWEFPDQNLTEAINGYDHDEHCDYLKLNTYSSIVSPKIGDETNQWRHCNCKAVYYSPIGNNIQGIRGFDNTKEYSDIVFADTGIEPFSFATWVGPDGKDYRTSDYFAVFKYSGREPDSGYGIGFWETLSGKSMTLEKGKSYIYRRASFGGCDDNRPPCFVSRGCHCYDPCDDSVCNPTWIKMIQNEDNEWVSTGEISDMILESGQFYEYEKVKQISYNIVKNGQIIERNSPTPSFAINIPFKEALPYWAISPTQGSLNIGLSAFSTTDYLLTTQPEPSEMIIESDSYVNYIRNSCEPFIWRQPLDFTIDLQQPNTWKKLNFNFTNPNLLQKIIGCGPCELVFADTPDSCFLKQNNCNSYIGTVTTTDEDSDMIIRTPSDCNSSTEIFFFAQNDFLLNTEILLSSSVGNTQTSVYVEANSPHMNFLNGAEPLIQVKESSEFLKTKNEIGILKPNLIGVNKVQCFNTFTNN